MHFKQIVNWFFSVITRSLIIFRLFVETQRSTGSAMQCTSTGNCVERHQLAASPVALEKVMVSHRRLVDRGKHVGSARTPCNFTENDKPIIIMYFFVLHLYGNIV